MSCPPYPIKAMQWCQKTTSDANELPSSLPAAPTTTWFLCSDCSFQPKVQALLQSSGGDVLYDAQGMGVVTANSVQTSALPTQNQAGSTGYHWIQVERSDHEAQRSHIWKRGMKTFKRTPDLACKHPDCICTVPSTLGFGSSRDQKIIVFLF